MYSLSSNSLRRLEGVDNQLVLVVKRAIQLSVVDFSVFEGLRTPARQKLLFNQGKSQTMNSRHLTGHAVDLVAWVNGKLDWGEWSHYYRIGEAMAQAAKELDVTIRWGGVWDRRLQELKPPFEHEVSGYVERRKAIGRSAFLDGPHFELLAG